MVREKHQPIKSLKFGHVTGRGSMSPIWVPDLGKIAFIKKCKHLDDIAVCFTTFLKAK